MRPIEFRAWDPDNKVMREYEYEKCVLMFNGAVGEFNGKQYDPRPHWILLQYIGLNDVTGTKIFEGDILAWIYKGKEEIGIVTRDSGYSCFCAQFDDNAAVFMHSDDEYKVIGNMYENPELVNRLIKKGKRTPSKI